MMVGENFMSEFVKLVDVRKIYQTGKVVTKAVDGIDFVIEKGEFAVIVGASGAGKTTVLNILGGMDRATSGHIYIDGNDIAAYNERQLTKYRRDDIGFVFQFYNLVQNLTAKENVELATQICKDSLDPEEVLEKVGLSERKNNFPSQLSGGEQQRVAIARAIAKNPKLLLCDEPTGALDSKSARQLLETFDVLNRSLGSTILMVTHDAFTASYADRIIFIKDGKIFNELTKGNSLRKQFFEKIIEVQTLLGGDLNDVI